MKQIYTGYQWREMTCPELEIMESSRIVAEKTDDAQAGDIYDGPDDCPYCIGDKNASRSVAGADSYYVDVYLHYNNIVVELHDPHGIRDDVEAKINYCPMCGRELEEANG